MSQPQKCDRCKKANPTYRGDEPGHFEFMPKDWREIVFKGKVEKLTVYVCPECFDATVAPFGPKPE